MEKHLISQDGGYAIAARENLTATIANGASVSDALDLANTSLLGIIMPAAWTTAALTVEVSADNSTWTGLAYDQDGSQCNSIASPVAGSAYALNALGLLPYRYIRLRSGTTATPVNQGAARSITVITRPLA